LGDRLTVDDIVLVELLLPSIVGYVEFHNGAHGSHDSIRMLIMESLDNRGDDGFLAKIYSSAIFIVVDLQAEQLPCWTKVHDLVFLYELRIDLDRYFGG
jgi:hypothetical protein